MKTPGRHAAITCAVCLILMALSAGCTQTPKVPLSAPAYSYDYFPIEAVYWDAHRRLWFYPWNGKWESAAELPVGIRIDIRNYVIVTMDTPAPYQHHEEVARRFPPGDYRQRRDAADVVVTIPSSHK